RRWRGTVSLVSAAYAAAVGVGLVVRVAHYPSDVVGGFLVAGAWAGAMSAVALARRRDPRPAPATPWPERWAPIAAWAAGTASAGIVVAVLLREPAAHL